MINNGTASDVVQSLLVEDDFRCVEGKLYRPGLRPVDVEEIDMLELDHFPISSEEKGTGTMVVPVDQIVELIQTGDAVALPTFRMRHARVASLLQSRFASRNPNGLEGLPEPRPEKLRHFIAQGVVFTGDMLPAASPAVPANG